MAMDVPNLLEAITAHSKADDDLRKAWHYGPFQRMLSRNVTDAKKSVAPASDEDYPRVRCYRGTGPKVSLAHAHFYEKENCVNLAVDIDFVGAEVSQFDEMEGCPGAPVKNQRFYFQVDPELIITLPTQSKFDAWAKAERKRQTDTALAKAKNEITRLAKNAGLKVTIS